MATYNRKSPTVKRIRTVSPSPPPPPLTFYFYFYLRRFASYSLRLVREAAELASSPSPDYHAAPLEQNLFEWHFTIRGPPDSPYAQGIYHGRINLPSAYPMRPPSFRFLSPSGRFEVNREICLSISNHHEDTWQPAWGVRTAVVALRGFMETNPGGQVGALDCSDEQRSMLAARSGDWHCDTCAKTSAQILKESELAAKELGCVADEKPPPGLTIGYKSEEQDEQDPGHRGEASAQPGVRPGSPAASASLAPAALAAVAPSATVAVAAGPAASASSAPAASAAVAPSATVAVAAGPATTYPHRAVAAAYPARAAAATTTASAEQYPGAYSRSGRAPQPSSPPRAQRVVQHQGHHAGHHHHQHYVRREQPHIPYHETFWLDRLIVLLVVAFISLILKRYCSPPSGFDELF